MKISQKAKKPGPPHPLVNSLITDILETPTEDLPQLFGPIQTWRWPRSDLNSWIDVLNKLDTILEDVIREYNIDDSQVNDFHPQKKNLVCEILRFERLLLENSTNRKLYNSYDRLNSFLFSSDLDVLVNTLFLLMRPSQQYSSHPALSHSQHISNSRLESLVKAPPSFREHGIELLDLVSSDSNERLKKLPQEASEVNFTFYRRTEHEAQNADAEQGKPSASSAHQPSAQAPAPYTIHLGPLAQSSRSSMEIFADTVKSHQVPDSEKYELLCRIRLAHALGADRESERQAIVTARLLALAVYAHTHPETQAQSTIFLFDADLVNRVGDLLQQDKGVHVVVQTAAIFALDALARYRGKMAEVLSAVNAGVNHGILMSLMRKSVQDICVEASVLPNIFMDALVSFITYIASHSSGGNMMVGAGLVPILIQLIGITHQQRLPIVSRTMQLIDSVLTGYSNAFTIFCNSGGIDALTGRMQYEVDVAIKLHGSDEGAQSPSLAYGLVMFTRAGVLKHMLRTMHRMMQSSGTTEGMRGLIDSSLLSSVSKIVQCRGVFGPTVLPIAINIVATFVHNEPTSLTAIQEAKVPEILYTAIEVGIEPSFEVIQAITNAVGALCLNQTGQDQLSGRPSIIPALFSIFTSEKHLKVLTDKENAASIGSSINELVRHHPTLKDAVFNSLLSTLRKIEYMGNSYEPPNDVAHFYMLRSKEKPSQQNDDIAMQDVPGAPDQSESTSKDETTKEGLANLTDEQSEKPHDNPIIFYIDCLGRFLEGLFQHATHCNDFISSAETLNCFSHLFALPCLPYDYANAVHSDSIVQVIRTMVEVAPVEILTHLAEKVKESLDESTDFWQTTSEDSKLLPFVEVEDEGDLVRGNCYFRKLVTLHNRLTLLSDVFATAGYAHSRNAVALLQSNAIDIIPSLGTLHRSCIWENIVLKNGLLAKNYGTSSSVSGITNSSMPLLPTDTTEDAPAATTSTQAPDPSTSSTKPDKVPVWNDNATALRHIANQIPNALGPFFQAISKMLFYNRRSPDDNQKRQAIALAETLANVMHKHLIEYTECEKSSSYAYHTVMLGLIAAMLFDERSTQNSYHAVLLYAFRKVGGVDAMLSTCRRYTDAISRISAINHSERGDADKEELVQVYGGLKMALHLIYSLISFRPSADPISQLISPGKADTHPDFYEPHDFLVKLRLTIAPLIIEIWRSSWLVSAPPLVSKYVVQCVQVLVAGSNEVPPADFNFNSEIMPSSAQGLLRLSGPPSEDRIRQLTDMGFQRGAAIRALQRTNNNVSFATEYLLSHPFETGPENPEGGNAAGDNEATQSDDEDEDEDEDDEASDANDPDTTDNPEQGNSNNGDTSAPENSTRNENEDEMDTEPVQEATEQAPTVQLEKTSEERRQEMDGLRKGLLNDIGPLSLRLADVHPALIFEIKQAFIGPADKYQADAIRCIVEDIEKFSPAAYDVKEEPLLVRIRLLALILAETPKPTMEALGEGGKGPQNLLNVLHALLLSHPIGLDKDQPLPAWLAALLLAMESIFVLAETPQSVQMVLPEQPIDLPELYTGPPYKEARTTVFELCMRLLEIQSVPRDELLATLRMLVLLTRNRDFANLFIQRKGVSLLMQRMKRSSAELTVPGIQVHIAIILRHLVEDRSVLESVMRQEIKRWFSSSRSKVIEVLAYVRNSHEMAARDPQIFVDMTKELCALVRPDVPNHQVTLRSDKAPAALPETQASGEQTIQMQVDSSASQSAPVNSESLEHVVHYMLGELLRAGKAASDKLRAEQAALAPEKRSLAVSEPSADNSHTMDADGAGSTPPTNDDPEDAHSYACFLMQSLSELLFSYEQCKLAFLTYKDKKHHATPLKDQAARHKSAALNFLLSELVSFGAFNVEAKFDAKKRIILCNWAMSVIVALCVDNSVSHGQPTQSTDLASIRKLVIESINRSIKEGPAGESVDTRYGRTLALADLCHRLLTVRLRSVGPSRAPEETPMQLAKIMLEKNFVATLTNVLSDVDLNYPNMRSLVTAVLRPLEYLTKVAIKMGRVSEKTKDSAFDTKSESSSSTVSSDEEEDDMHVEEREETPDLYRNSSLGMYAGEMEDASYNDDDETMDEGDEEEDEDVEVDYDEDTGSDDSSHTDPEDGADEEVIAADVDGRADEWDDVDEDMDGVEEGVEDDEDDDEDEDIDEDGEDGEMLWQGAGVADVAGDIVNDAGDDDDAEEIGIVDGDAHGLEDEDADAFSEDQDLAEEDLVEIDNIPVSADGLDNPFGFSTRHLGRPPLGFRSHLFFGNNVVVRNRNLDSDMQIFSRPRYNNANPEAMTHPLLLDSNVSNPPSGQIRVQTRRSRFGGGNLLTSSSSYPDILQTIEELVGGGALQLVQELMNRGGLHPLGADIHVEVPTGTAGLLQPERTSLHRHARSGISATVGLRDSRSGASRSDSGEFGPLPTIQRWQQEAELTHGKHAQGRFQRLCNHIILSLLPEARELARIEREREERERVEREEKERVEREAAEKKAAQEGAERSEKEAAEKEAAEESAERTEAEQQTRDETVIMDAEDQREAQAMDAEQAAQEVPNQSIVEAAINQDPGEEPEDAEMHDAAAVSEQLTRLPVPGRSTEASRSLLVPERVYVTINGEQVDITETGIDPTFLEALPDDMREEVLNQHLREIRVSRNEPPADSQINAEFLDALPPELRAEILREERLERSRREREQNTSNETRNAQGGPADIDAADFIASLDPQLRQVVLLDSDDGILQTLPSHMVAEAGMYRGLRHGGDSRREAQQGNQEASQVPPSANRKIAQVRDAIQLLDRGGLIALIRLLFFSHLSKRSVLHKVLLNLCENAKSRTELFSLLLSILQEGTGDVAIVDKSFSQLSFKNTKAASHSTPAKSAGKHKESNLGGPPIVPNDTPPDIVAQRCLDALSFIVSSNELSSLFFLTEHELPAGLKKNVSKKGKGKEKQAAQTYYPLVLLLGLLERQSLLKTSSIMDAVAGLLDAVTRPLTSLKDIGSKSVKPEEEVTGVDQVTQQGAANSDGTAMEPIAIAATSNTAPISGQPTQDDTQNKGSNLESVEEKLLLANPPQIPHPALRSIVNILTIGECSSRTFQHTLGLIQHLSFLPDARGVVAQELKVKAHDFGSNLSADLDELIKALNCSARNDLPASIVTKFSPASSDQAKLLRVLKTIDYMYSNAAAGSTTVQQPEHPDGAKEIYETFRFTPLWEKLGDCLTVVEQKADIENVATILLPLIESLMVVCKNVGVKSTSHLGIPGSPRSPLPTEQSVDDLFVAFTDNHRKVLNLMVRNNPSLMSGSFSLLVQNPRVLDFDNKRNYFNQQLHRRPHPRDHHGSLQLNVRRARVFEDSFHAFQHKTGDQIKYGKLSVRFYGEEGVDAGGLTREWFQILARQMFDPNYALFEPCAADRQTYQPNRASAINPDHLSYFKFVGRVIGKAIYDGRLMDAHFARSLYRQLLGKPVDYRDVEWVDPEYYKSLCWILENDPTILDLTFITEVDEFGKHAVIELKENGASTLVTLENRKEYVQLSAQYRLYSSIKEQIEHLLSGFYEVVPKDLISIFNEQEVELLISGTPDIDVDEWRSATEYNGYTSSDPVIVWWWRALKSFNRDERAKVLSFATGTSRVPLGGFVELQGVQGNQRFSIHKAYGDTDRLPQAHTCFNQIDLPEYTSYEKLRQQLLLAINEGGEGFGFA